MGASTAELAEHVISGVVTAGLTTLGYSASEPLHVTQS